MDVNEVRRLVEKFHQQQELRSRNEAELQKLAHERAVFDDLKARPGLYQGWRVNEGGPIHRLAEKNAPLEQLVRELAQTMPLTNRVLEYGGYHWWLVRDLVSLTDEELDSDYRYRAAYEKQVAMGKAEPRKVRTSAPDEEPTGGERYAIKVALEAAGQAGVIKDYAVRRIAGNILQALVNPRPLAETLEMQFKWDTDCTPLAAKVGQVAKLVPEVGRLVSWLAPIRKPEPETGRTPEPTFAEFPWSQTVSVGNANRERLAAK